MTTLILTVIATALLSSFITLTVGFICFKKYYEKNLDETIARFKQEVGTEVEIRVKKGVVEGIKSFSSREVIKDTTMNLAKTGLDIFGMATRPRQSGRRPGGGPLDED